MVGDVSGDHRPLFLSPLRMRRWRGVERCDPDRSARSPRAAAARERQLREGRGGGERRVAGQLPASRMNAWRGSWGLFRLNRGGVNSLIAFF